MERLLKKVLYAVVVFFVVLSFNSLDANAATDANKAAASAVIKQMLMSGDTTQHDVYQYGLTYADVCNIFNEVKLTDECIVAYNACDSLLVTCTYSGSYVKYVSLPLPADFATRRANLQAVVDTVLSGIDSKMSNLDKVLYVHDYLVYNTAYDTTLATASGYPYSSLVLDKAVCVGYSGAMQIFLNLFNINYVQVSGNGGSHTWLQVEIDGNYYHLDPTWDDPTANVLGRTLHTYFLLNDTEIKALKHYGWTDPIIIKIGTVTYTKARDFRVSTSTTYSNSFLHNVNGRMIYNNGTWTYINASNKVARIAATNLTSDKTGSTSEILVDANVDAVDKYKSYLIYSSGKSVYASNMDGKNSKLLFQISDLVSGKESIIDYLFIEGNTLTYTAYNYTVSNGTYTVYSKNSVSVDLSTFDFTSIDKIVYPTTSVEGTEFTNVSNWMSGMYHWTTGAYTSYPSRICLNDYKTFISGSTYTITLSDANYKMLVRELDSNKKFLRTVTLSNGNTYAPGTDATYLAVSIYNPNNATLTFANYETLFKSGLTIGMTAGSTSAAIATNTIAATTTTAAAATTTTTAAAATTQTTTTVATDTAAVVTDTTTVTTTSTEATATVEATAPVVTESTVSAVVATTTDTTALSNCNLSLFSNWQTGMYDWTTGVYMSYPSRICLTEYKTFTAGTTLTATLSNTNYKILVRELDASKKFLRTVTLSSGNTYTPGTDATYLAISIYNPSIATLTYADYTTLFANGFTVSLN